MAHDFIFSIIGAHVNNANEQLERMFEVEKYSRQDINYNQQENEIFNTNVKHGILFVYSLNAALESIVCFLSDDRGYNKCNCIGEFYERVTFLESKKVISVNEDILSRCYELRKTRNLVTHWEKNLSKSLGSMNYLPYMFGNVSPEDDHELLISRLNKSNINNYLDSFYKLLDNIISNESNSRNTGTVYFLETIKSGNLIFEDMGV